MNYDMGARLERIERRIADGPYAPTWQSLSGWELPRWYRDAKLGMFIHWGVYSVPAFGSEWYSRNMYIKDSAAYRHHIEHYGPHAEFGYKDFIDRFRGERFDADEWMDLARESGAKYVVPVAEHHDGFAMYDCGLSRYTSVNMGPRRDVIGELFDAALARGLQPCASTHRLEHWFFMGRGREFDSDISAHSRPGELYWPSLTPDPSFTDPDCAAEPPRDFLDDWLIRTCDFIDRYMPRLLYFDWWIHHRSAKERLRKIAAYYYNTAAARGCEVVINYKYDAFALGTATLDLERGRCADAKPFFWQACTSTSRSAWGYVEGAEYKSAGELVCALVDVVSKNGCMLLNIGPKADGTIAEPDVRILRELGAWLRVNGESVYGASPWKVCAEGSAGAREGQFADSEPVHYTCADIRYCVNNGCIYATPLAASPDGEYLLSAFALPQDIDAAQGFVGIVAGVECLAGAPLSWERGHDGLRIRCGYTGALPPVFRISAA
ncbi:MAG: alpha-L-fucosidase [Clostridia bacterium]|nr:alpha-L-fucosidase [Clostridia bacterium]